MHGIAEKKIDKTAIFISCLLLTLKTVPKRIRRMIPENSAPVEKRPNATVYALLPNAYADLAIKGIVPNRIPEMIVQIIPVVSEAKPLFTTTLPHCCQVPASSRSILDSSQTS